MLPTPKFRTIAVWSTKNKRQNKQNMKIQRTRQIAKYIIIGLLSNATGYGVYLLLTHFSLSPKIAMTLLYFTSATLSFFANKKITFSHSGQLVETGLRYVIVQLIGYAINLAILMVFVDQFGYNHKIVQSIAILTVACYLFISLKLFVFRRAA